MSEYQSEKSNVATLEAWANICDETGDLTGPYKLAFDLEGGEYVLRGTAHFHIIAEEAHAPYVLSCYYSPEDREPFASVTLGNTDNLKPHDIVNFEHGGIKLPKEVGRIIPQAETAGNALSRQEGGMHYKDCLIQPIEYAHRNKLGPNEFNIVKYATRWRSKGGIEDLRKIKHSVDLLIELEGLE